MVGTTFDSQTREMPAEQPTASQNFLVLQRAESPTTVQLSGSRVSIGSDPDCDLRLLDPAVARMHALIVVGEARTVVRSLEEGILLNGSALTESELHPGDMLRVGESQVIFLSQEQQQSEPELETAAAPGHDWDEFQSRFTETCQVIEARFDSLQELVEMVQADGQSTASQVQATESQLVGQAQRSDAILQRISSIEAKMSQFVTAAGNRFREIAAREQQLVQNQARTTEEFARLQKQFEQTNSAGQQDELVDQLRQELSQSRDELSSQTTELREQIETWMAATEDRLPKTDELSSRIEDEFNRARDEQDRLHAVIARMESHGEEDSETRERLTSLAEAVDAMQTQFGPQLNDLVQRLDRIVDRQDQSGQTIAGVQESLEAVQVKMAHDKLQILEQLEEFQRTGAEVVPPEADSVDAQTDQPSLPATLGQTEVDALKEQTPVHVTDETASEEQSTFSEPETVEEQIAADELSADEEPIATAEGESENFQTNFDADETLDFLDSQAQDPFGPATDVDQQFATPGEELKFGAPNKEPVEATKDSTADALEEQPAEDHPVDQTTDEDPRPDFQAPQPGDEQTTDFDNEFNANAATEHASEFDSSLAGTAKFNESGTPFGFEEEPSNPTTDSSPADDVQPTAFDSGVSEQSNESDDGSSLSDILKKYAPIDEEADTAELNPAPAEMIEQPFAESDAATEFSEQPNMDSPSAQATDLQSAFAVQQVAQDPQKTESGEFEAEFGEQQSVEQTGQEEDDDTIEDYMAQLMNRVRGMADENEQKYSSQPTSSSDNQPEISAKTAPGTVTPPEMQQPSEPETPRAPRERVAPPEQSSLAAMRDLANMSTRGALATHTRNEKINSVQLKLILAVGALVGSLVLLWFSHTSGNTFAYVGSVASMLVAIYFGVRYLMLTGQLFEKELGKSANSQEADPPSTENTTEA